MSDNSKRCADCSFMTLEGDCTNPNTIKDIRGMFKRPDSNRIIHPEITWCVNIKPKTVKESYEKEV